MVDIFLPPRKEKLEKLQKYLADPLVYGMFKALLRNMGERNKGSYETLWYSMTRQMFINYPAAVVYNQVEQALNEASNEQWFEKKFPKGFFNEEFVFPKPKIIRAKGKVRKIIDKHLKITDVAKKYGLKIKGNMSECPFHADKNPSLSFNDDKNVFHCFGCGAKGDIIEFIRKMEEGFKAIETLMGVKNGKKRG